MKNQKPCRCLLCEPRQQSFLAMLFWPAPFVAACATRLMTKRLEPVLREAFVAKSRLRP